MSSNKTLPSPYCQYADKCPSRNRSAICVPCMYKSHTGLTKPKKIQYGNTNCKQAFKCYNPISNLTCDDCLNYANTGVFDCRCTTTNLCKSCYKYMYDYVFPKHSQNDPSFWPKGFDLHSNYASF
jgi:hypothetical protein